MSNISIIIADSQYLIRAGLRHILMDKANCTIISEVTNEVQLFLEMKKQQPDVVVLDYQQPGHFSTETVAKLKKEYPKVGLLVISTDENKKNIYDVLENGGEQFFIKKMRRKGNN